VWKYEFSRTALKSLNTFPQKDRLLIEKKIKNIGDWFDDKANLTADIRKLRGEWEGFYRLRVGKSRIIFSIDEENEIIRIHDIGYRGNIYK
jgi:mRNA interferase RelE/StbE